ncbi:hypothetical protein Vretimale_19924 [Volvox reticuliferus]|nr:hypothetical protein Vretifemale_20907 [Volvox reticuliferus]GIM17371.1 hypothetical protein Vretimale_19924 [Volvox reticuliferus]
MHAEAAVAAAQGIRTHMVAAGALRAGEGAPPEERHVVTPLDMEERAALAHEMTFHPTAEASGARLDPTDPKAPFGATVKNAEGEPVTERDGPLDDPYGISNAGGGVTAAAAAVTAPDDDGDDVIFGDGSLVGAEAAIEAICGAGEDASASKV